MDECSTMKVVLTNLYSYMAFVKDSLAVVSLYVHVLYMLTWCNIIRYLSQVTYEIPTSSALSC